MAPLRLAALTLALTATWFDPAFGFTAAPGALLRTRASVAAACSTRGHVQLRMADPPAYNSHPCSVVRNEEIAPGSRLIRLKAEDAGIVDGYLPGHVLALELLTDPGGVEAQNNEGKHGNGMKGPYTVTRADWETGTVDVVFRVIQGGRLSERLARVSRGTKMNLGGRFKVPIEQGIAKDAELVVGVSTGVGLGPLLGFAERELEATDRRIALFAGFRDAQDMLFEEEFEALQDEYPGRLSFTACISTFRDERYPPPPGFDGLRGRVTHAVPRALEPEAVASAHFHLIGNGAMVNTFKAGLAAAGVPDARVTLENYFNHR
ncbi:hypothetical protein T484DRAFT_1971337, partial [Baffinella frigidus]